MEKEKLLELYKPFIEEISFEEFKEKCINREIDHLMPVSKAIVVDYMGNEPQVQADFLLNMLIDNEIVFSIELNPSKIFEKIYSIKSTNVTDIVAILKDNVINMDNFVELYGETLDEFTLDKYLKNQQVFIQKHENREMYDPLKFEESQKKIDNLKQQLDDGIISLGEFLKNMGIIDDYDNKKIIDIVEKIVKNKIEFSDLQKMYNSGKINTIELEEISNIIKKQYPEINEKFNKSI